MFDFEKGTFGRGAASVNMTSTQRLTEVIRSGVAVMECTVGAVQGTCSKMDGQVVKCNGAKRRGSDPAVRPSSAQGCKAGATSEEPCIKARPRVRSGQIEVSQPRP